MPASALPLDLHILKTCPWVAQVNKHTEGLKVIGRRILLSEQGSSDAKAKLSPEEEALLKLCMKTLINDIFDLQRGNWISKSSNAADVRRDQLEKVQLAYGALHTVLSEETSSSGRKHAMMTFLETLCEVESEEDRQAELWCAGIEPITGAAESWATQSLEGRGKSMTFKDRLIFLNMLKRFDGIAQPDSVSEGSQGSTGQGRLRLFQASKLSEKDLESFALTVEDVRQIDAIGKQWMKEYLECCAEAKSKDSDNAATDVSAECPTQ